MRSSPGTALPRQRHYATFYGLEPLPTTAPLVLIHGNCQAESLRLALAGPNLTTVRIPPVHELTSADLPHLRRALAGADVLISQLHDSSLAALHAREAHHATLPVSDLLERPDFELMRTINHPGNPIWEALARRVRDRLGVAPGPELSRPLLNHIHAPREPAVIEAFGLAGAADLDWLVGERRVGGEELTALHLGWYRAHPDVVTAGLVRHRDTLNRLAQS